MRFTVCSIASVALLLGGAHEPVQAASLLTQHDSQGAFDELLQLDVGTDVDVYGDANAEVDADAELKNKSEKLAIAVQSLRDYLDETETKYTNWKYQKNHKGEAYDYCSSKQKLDNESTRVESDLNEKIHEVQKAIDALATQEKDKNTPSEHTIPHFWALSTQDELATLLGVAPDTPSDDQILDGIKTSRKMLKERIEKDFNRNNVDQKEKLDVHKEDHNKYGSGRKNKVAEMTKALNYWGGSYDTGRNKSTWLKSNDNRRYLGSKVFATHLIKESCKNEGSEAATTGQAIAGAVVKFVTAIQPLLADLAKITAEQKLGGPNTLVNVSTG